MTAFSKTILGKILGGAAQVIATPLGLGNVAHAAMDKVSDAAQNVITGRNRVNVAADIQRTNEASAAQNKVNLGVNVNSGAGGTSVGAYLNTGQSSAGGMFNNLIFWIQNNVMMVLAIGIGLYFLLRKKKRR